MAQPRIPQLPFDSIHLVHPPEIFQSEPNWKWESAITSYYNLWIALEGMGSMICEGNPYPIQAGTAFILPPGCTVSASHNPQRPIRNFACHFLLTDRKHWANPAKGTPFFGVQVVELVRMKELTRAAVQCRRYPDELAKQQCSGLCFQILAQVWRDAHSPLLQDVDVKLLDLIDRLIEQPSQWLTREQMAHEAGLSVVQFNRRFTALAGSPPAQFAIQQRILRACQLLKDSPLQVGQIAEALGYRDIYYFSRQFKRITGIAPTEYRLPSA